MLTIKQIKLIGLRCRSFIQDECEECLCCDRECLAGACAVTSFAMGVVLDEHGHDTTFVMQDMPDSHGRHCYLELYLNDIKHVVDVTATQFFCEKYREDPDDWSQYIDECLIEPAKAYRKRNFTEGRRTLDLDALIKIKRGWSEQSPSRYEKKIMHWADRACRGLEDRATALHVDIGSDVQAPYGRDRLGS